MIRSLKIARWSRFAALLAGFLSVSGAFGLHPEPTAISPAGGAVMEWTSSAQAIEASPHVCLACLAHRSVPLPGLNAVVFAPRPAVSRPVRQAPLALSRADSHTAEGRAPPALG